MRETSLHRSPAPALAQACTRAASRLRFAALGLAAGLLSLAAQAQINPDQRGPNPTAASLEATAGPYAVKTSKVASQSNFGGGTVYFPDSNEGPFGVIAIAPGFTEGQSVNSWWGNRLASHGFVVITASMKNVLQYPTPRAKELVAALNYVVAQSQTSGSPYFGKVDPARRGVMGHSMGGGGTLEVVRDDPTIKAAIPLAPWDLSKVFTQVTTPTLIVACEKDAIAPVNTHASTFYDSLSASLDKAFLELKGADHFCTNTSTTAARKTVLGKYGVAWMKRFIDSDTRYAPFLCGATHEAYLSASSSVISRYKSSCPY